MDTMSKPIGMGIHNLLLKNKTKEFFALTVCKAIVRHDLLPCQNHSYALMMLLKTARKSDPEVCV